MKQIPEKSKLISVHSPFFVTLKDGIDRLFEVLQDEEFIFVVKGEELKLTIAESVLISSKVQENLRSAPEHHRFEVETDEEKITKKDFIRFIDFVHSNDCSKYSESERKSFLFICKVLGNEGLTFLLIDSLRPKIGFEDEGNYFTQTGSKEIEVSEHFNFDNFEVNHCASHFHEYSVELIRLLNKSTLHEILCSKELKLLSEDDLLELLIELGAEYFEYWCYIEVSFLSSSGLSLFVEHLKYEDLSESIWLKVVDRLKISQILDSPFKSPSNCQRYLKVNGFESLIVKDYPMILREFQGKTWKLLYRGSRDGFRASNFHEKCDNQTNTLTLIETTKDFIFGGFTPIAWDSSSGSKSDNSGKSFLFSLKNPRKSELRKFMLMSGQNAIYCTSSYGPWFPGNHDMIVYDNCNTSNSNYTNLGGSYVNDTGIDGKLVFTGEQYFTVKEIEVFTIIF
jgi:hypothetical protein